MPNVLIDKRRSFGYLAVDSKLTCSNKRWKSNNKKKNANPFSLSYQYQNAVTKWRYIIFVTDMLLYCVIITKAIGLTPSFPLIYISAEPAVTQNCDPLLQTITKYENQLSDQKLACYYAKGHSLYQISSKMLHGFMLWDLKKY